MNAAVPSPQASTAPLDPSPMKRVPPRRPTLNFSRSFLRDPSRPCVYMIPLAFDGPSSFVPFPCRRTFPQSHAGLCQQWGRNTRISDVLVSSPVSNSRSWCAQVHTASQGCALVTAGDRSDSASAAGEGRRQQATHRSRPRTLPYHTPASGSAPAHRPRMHTCAVAMCTEVVSMGVRYRLG